MNGATSRPRPRGSSTASSRRWCRPAWPPSPSTTTSWWASSCRTSRRSSWSRIDGSRGSGSGSSSRAARSGRRLVEAGCAIEREQGEALSSARGRATGGETFLEATGFAYPLVGVGPRSSRRRFPWLTPALPDGYHARPFRRAADLETWVAAFNEAFTGHPTPLSLDADVLCAVDRGRRHPRRRHDPRRGRDGPARGVRRDRAAVPGRRVGRSRRRRSGRSASGPGSRAGGWGARRSGSGIARLRAIGASTVTLSVSGRNPRAVALYEAEGFVRVVDPRPLGAARGWPAGRRPEA